ncbi:MAG: recombination protein RecR [Proteobacteria bacterium]|jgi:recombination protein RecR|nr:recombination protein RecR [Pseudomonadota bacterium]
MLTPSLQHLVDAFAQLPGIGRKSATRLAFHLMRQDAATSEALAHAILDAHAHVHFCEFCQDLCEASPCEMCQDPTRDSELLCIVETPQDLHAIEATREYRGRYHVLHGAISPLEGISPRDLKIAELLARLKTQSFREIILATNPSVEGEATALYLKNLLRPLCIPISRIASGLPMGAHLEFADKATLGRSILDRRAL